MMQQQEVMQALRPCTPECYNSHYQHAQKYNSMMHSGVLTGHGCYRQQARRVQRLSPAMTEGRSDLAQRGF